MRGINILVQEANQEARAAKAAELNMRAKRWKSRTRTGIDQHLPNVYQLHTSGKPVGEFREMTHAEARILNQKMFDDFRSLVIAAIDSGGKHDGTLSAWRIYKHHSQDVPAVDEPPAARAARAHAVKQLNQSLRSAASYKAYKRRKAKEPPTP